MREAFARRFRERRLLAVASAHNPLSARLVAEAGFDGIWASGFELSAAWGVPDASILTMTQHLEVTRAMAAAVALPVVADLDTGHGNAVNVLHAVALYAAAGAAAVVIEDKSFPKDTSLRPGGRQELVRAEEFQGKIEAALAARGAAGTLVIARTEALIAGAGMAEALERARLYAAAGADGILVHSKQPTPDEVEAFIAAWDGTAPLVLVPTAYPQLAERQIAASGKVGMVIYGNHTLRGAVTGMQEALRRIRADGGAQNADAAIVPVSRIFDLQGVEGMKAQEKRFLR